VGSLSSLFSCSFPIKRGLHHTSGACAHELARPPAGLLLWPCSGKCWTSDTLVEYVYPVSFAIPNALEISDSITVSVVQYSNPSENTNSFFGQITRGGVCFQLMFTMNPGQYHHRPQNNTLPMNFQYTENPDSPLQSVHGMFSFDGLPRTHSDQNFLTPSLTSNVVSGNYSLVNQMSISQASLAWADSSQIASNFEDQNTNDYYDYSPNIMGNAIDLPFLRGVNLEIPRWMPDEMGVHSDNNMPLDGHEHPLYMMDPNKPDTQATSSARSNTVSNTMDNSRDFARLSISTSPKMERDIVGNRMLFDKPSPLRLPSSETSENGGNSSREMTAVEGEEPAADEPYAKLIYRALMSAPNHSMVLQEIYQWFRENTVKGSSDTKGWMNSIRHNLSMNAVRLFAMMLSALCNAYKVQAFKKTERKIPGDDTKKSTEWVLEDFAIKDGVQSTTRYRNTAKKSTRMDNPVSARQSSGRKGGVGGSKNITQKQRAKEDRSVIRRPTPRVGIPTPISYPGRVYATPRQRSPLTPPHPEHVLSSSPYFFPKHEQYDLPFENMCGLEDVQGVQIDDSPLFSNNHEPHFHIGHPMSNQPY
jgi:hypothetical protein